MRHRLLLVALLAAALAGCRGGAASPAPSVGEGGVVRGVVTAGPTCPVEQVPPASTCAARAVTGALLLIEDADGRRLDEVRSGPGGEFAASLPAGMYRLVPQPVEGLLGTAAPVGFEVRMGETTGPLAVVYDTGIR